MVLEVLVGTLLDFYFNHGNWKFGDSCISVRQFPLMSHCNAKKHCKIQGVLSPTTCKKKSNKGVHC
jgi:hypothetical protein